MEVRTSILFFGKKTKNESDKELSIYLRVTINGERFEVGTQRYIEPNKWSSAAGKVKENSEEARSINQNRLCFHCQAKSYHNRGRIFFELICSFTTGARRFVAIDLKLENSGRHIRVRWNFILNGSTSMNEKMARNLP